MLFAPESMSDEVVLKYHSNRAVQYALQITDCLPDTWDRPASLRLVFKKLALSSKAALQ
jgi:hypothetical protein